VLGVARFEVRHLREPRQLALRRLAAQALLELRRADEQSRSVTSERLSLAQTITDAEYERLAACWVSQRR
jgi:hypothetical protein